MPSPFGKALNRLMSFLIGTVGLNVQGAMVLDVRGRRSGRVSSRPVNPLTLGSERYLLSPQGETQWVRNIRATGEGTLRRGRTVEVFRVEEVPDDEKLPIMRAYLERWSWQVKSLMGVDKTASDAALQQIAPTHPVFRLVPKGQ
ncbi:MAG TPA: nitroreductase/quinone reductase family protein [Thermomicrobiales bacterium]|nr:nitroreductase/quinone reductase family protein [Thermomicrobiales bacterium]